MSDYSSLPAGLPVPQDDGAAAHLVGLVMPHVVLPATAGPDADLGHLPPGRNIIFAYPMTGRPGVALPEGWNEIPGARGCTPQNCSVRDAHDTFKRLGASVFGLSTQDKSYQLEMAGRLHLPYPVLSDAAFVLTDALSLPTFEAEGKRLLRRLTLVVRDGVIEHVFYPVFPPDRSTDDVIAWLQAHQGV